MEQEKLIKKIKKNLYGKLQSIQAIYPAGFSEVALEEIHAVLQSPWFTPQFLGQSRLQKNEIRIDNIHLFSITELLMRSQCLSDIRLIIFSGKTVGKIVFEKKCRQVPWEFFVKEKLSIKIKVDSIASRAFHESGLKKIVSDILSEYGVVIVSGDEANEDTSIYVNLYQDRLTMSISLAGSPLYKRGYRTTLSVSAPLREDIAACCLRQALQFAKKWDEQFFPDNLLIPFSGTGTFAFEYLQDVLHYAPVLFHRRYALEKMPLFRQENFIFLVKKAEASIKKTILNKISVWCIDSSESANVALQKNKEIFQTLLGCQDTFHLTVDPTDLLKWDFQKKIAANQQVFIPMNPPYGIRLNKQSDTIALYKNIATKINKIAKHSKKTLGFILCPTEETWSIFCKNIKTAHHETYHFTQGGLDVRVCQFFIP